MTVVDWTMGFRMGLSLKKIMPRSSTAKNRSPREGSVGSALAKKELAGLPFEPLHVAAAVLTSDTSFRAPFATEPIAAARDAVGAEIAQMNRLPSRRSGLARSSNEVANPPVMQTAE